MRSSSHISHPIPELRAWKDGIFDMEWDGERIILRRLCQEDMCDIDREFSMGESPGIV